MFLPEPILNLGFLSERIYENVISHSPVQVQSNTSTPPSAHQIRSHASMPFFENATNFKITGGTFNTISGGMNQYINHHSMTPTKEGSIPPPAHGSALWRKSPKFLAARPAGDGGSEITGASGRDRNTTSVCGSKSSFVRGLNTPSWLLRAKVVTADGKTHNQFQSQSFWDYPHLRVRNLKSLNYRLDA